jgi:hypothetical protein
MAMRLFVTMVSSLGLCIWGSSFDLAHFTNGDCSGDSEHVSAHNDGQCFSSIRGNGSSFGICSQDMKTVEFHWYENCADCSCAMTTVRIEPVGACLSQAGVVGTSWVMTCHDSVAATNLQNPAAVAGQSNDAKSLLASATPQAKDVATFQFCGRYCGPGWCNDDWIREEDCDDSADASWGSCTDGCCREHDRCCGHASDTRSCNSDFIDCLTSTCIGESDVFCFKAGIPVPESNLIAAAAMGIFGGDCCGGPCPNVGNSSVVVV